MNLSCLHFELSIQQTGIVVDQLLNFQPQQNKHMAQSRKWQVNDCFGKRARAHTHTHALVKSASLRNVPPDSPHFHPEPCAMATVERSAYHGCLYRLEKQGPCLNVTEGRGRCNPSLSTSHAHTHTPGRWTRALTKPCLSAGLLGPSGAPGFSKHAGTVRCSALTHYHQTWHML